MEHLRATLHCAVKKQGGGWTVPSSPKLRSKQKLAELTWKSFCDEVQQHVDAMRPVQTLGQAVQLAKSITASLKQKPKSFFPAGYAQDSYHLKWLIRVVILARTVN